MPRGLNPCFSGTCSLSETNKHLQGCCAGLNPCFSGTCSLRTVKFMKFMNLTVLILVLVELAL